MATLSIILDKRSPNKQGLFPIKIQINNGKTNTSVSTKLFVAERFFIRNGERVVDRNCPNASAINARVKQMYMEYTNAITEMDYDGKLLRASAASIRDYVKRKNQYIEEITFSSEIDQYISTCRAKKTKDGYLYARDTLYKYMCKTTIYFDELNYATLTAFDRWLEKRGLSINSRGVIMRYIRTIFNAAIKTDKLAPEVYPFRKFAIKKAAKEKEFLRVEELRTLRALDLKGNKRVARDFFLLSFYLCGVNPTDLFRFPKPDKNGYLVFVRQKIAHTEPMPIHLHIPTEAQEIIERYAGKTHLLWFVEHHEFETFKRRVSKQLAEIGEMIGRHLYFYMARYTWATFADHLGVSHDVISKALGHSDKSTAEKYYISFNWERVNEANRQVIDYVR